MGFTLAWFSNSPDHFFSKREFHLSHNTRWHSYKADQTDFNNKWLFQYINGMFESLF